MCCTGPAARPLPPPRHRRPLPGSADRAHPRRVLRQPLCRSTRHPRRGLHRTRRLIPIAVPNAVITDYDNLIAQARPARPLARPGRCRSGRGAIQRGAGPVRRVRSGGDDRLGEERPGSCRPAPRRCGRGSDDLPGDVREPGPPLRQRRRGGKVVRHAHGGGVRRGGPPRTGGPAAGGGRRGQAEVTVPLPVWKGRSGR